MISYVLDASVAVKWVLPEIDEPLSQQASSLFAHFRSGDVRLSVPDLFWAEVGSVLCKSIRTGRMPEQAALEGMDQLLSLNVRGYPILPLTRNAFRLALTFQRSIYDSLYLALAIQNNTPLITADERLVNAVGTMLPVRWLGSLV